MLWEPSGIRTGYSLYIVFTGVSQGQPTINIKALDDGVGTAIHTADIPNNSDFELFVHIQFLDRLPAPDGTSLEGKVWVSVSHSLRTRTSHTTYTDIVTIDSTGGVKNFTVEVVCENNEQLDLYSYIVEAKTNT